MENTNIEKIIANLIKEWNFIRFSKEKLLAIISHSYEKEENYESNNK